jgi:hypothetical protein
MVSVNVGRAQLALGALLVQCPPARSPKILFSVGSVAVRPRNVYPVRTSTDRILRIPNRYWFAMGPRRDQQQLLSHFGESGTAVFAVEEI